MKRMMTSFFGLAALAAALVSQAAPTSAEQAAQVVGNWRTGNETLGSGLGSGVRDVRTVETAKGARFHVVRLQGGGFVVVSGDTCVEPIIAFSASGDLTESEDHPLYALLSGDLSRRSVKVLKAAMATGTTAVSVRSAEEAKWAELLVTDETASGGARKVLKAAAGKTNVSDCRVAPLLTTEWAQKGPRNVVGETALCYNYFTPNNYPCGCVATACAQIMYYHRHPSVGYAWDQMVDKPANGISDAGARAIGRLTADIGLICGAEYHPTYAALGGYMIAPLLTSKTFGYGYAAAIAIQTTSGMAMSDFKAALIPNLDAGLPVAVAVDSSLKGGHELVADGYGYDYGTLYMHVNMGWAGLGDAWYAPPAVGDFDVVDGVVFNIRPTGLANATLVSGRVLNAETGAPVVGAKVIAGSVSCVTDAKGIYALALAPGKTYTLTASSGSLRATKTVSVKANVGTEVDFSDGTFYDNATTVANQYGVDLELEEGEEPGPDPKPEPEPEEPSVEVSCALDGEELVPGANVFEPVEIACTACKVKSVKATGLPSGLKLVSGKKAAPYDYAIAGNPKKASAKPFAVKIAVQVTPDDKKVKVPPQVSELSVSVLPLDAWGVGTFSGIADVEGQTGVLTLTVKNTGAISGKVTIGKKSHSFKANGFEFVSEDGYRVCAELPKLDAFLDFDLQSKEFGDDTVGFADNNGVNVGQEIWKLPAYKKFLKAYMSPDKEISWTTAGKVTWQKTVEGGKKAKKLTATLLPLSTDEDETCLYTYFVDGDEVTQLDVTIPADGSEPSYTFTIH